ncbi:Fic family protein [Sphingomonas sp.]|uniref:Fic family protein n=1 Tax=Sphingomonas sp. TaxID=28214 RepID=UPI002DD6A832|nr:Fic family protein [Sphingomonas sp.]
MAIEIPGRPADAQLMGYAELIEHFQLDCPPPRRLTALSTVGQKAVVTRDGIDWLLLSRNANYRVPNDPIEHISVALKHEGVDLRVLDRLFARPDVAPALTRHIEGNPRGIYTRRAWFLYEWMTGQRLPIDDVQGVSYIPLLDPNLYIGRRPTRSVRHKIANNLPGVPGFCPLIRRTERLGSDRIDALQAEARDAVDRADPAILRRATNFLLLNESKGSFGIEGETPPRNRLERWGRVIAEARDVALSLPSLEQLHRSLFDPAADRFVVYGLRADGGFVGRHDHRDQTPVPDHISARSDDLPSLLNAIFAAYDLCLRSRFDPILTATLLGFGFVFVHPFGDGNGRLHRFLIQKALAETGFNPAGVVLPVSAAILEDLPGYRVALEDYSSVALPHIEWMPTDDGNVRVLNDTAYLYRYFDATRQAEYLIDRIERTIRFSLPAELDYLQRFDEAKRRLADAIDLPDRLASLFIQFCAQNDGRLSARKRAEFFPALTDAELDRMEAAVARAGVPPSYPAIG